MSWNGCTSRVSPSFKLIPPFTLAGVWVASLHFAVFWYALWPSFAFHHLRLPFHFVMCCSPLPFMQSVPLWWHYQPFDWPFDWPLVFCFVSSFILPFLPLISPKFLSLLGCHWIEGMEALFHHVSIDSLNQWWITEGHIQRDNKMNDSQQRSEESNSS